MMVFFKKERPGLYLRDKLPTKSRKSLFYQQEKTHVHVLPIDEKIISDMAIISSEDASLSGSALTGFLDIEKLIEVNSCDGFCKKTYFLEKIVPFQVLQLDVTPCEEE